MPELSIIMPVYNGSKFLDSAIKSVISCGVQDFELLLVDDGSQDDSFYLLKKWSMIDKRIRIYKKKNEGTAQARNYALMRATGTYISFIDQDDTYLPGVLPVLLDQIVENQVDVIYTNCVETHDGKKIKRSTITQNCIIQDKSQIERILKSLILQNRDRCKNELQIDPSIWNAIYKKEYIIQHNIKFRAFVNYEDDFIFNLDVLRFLPKLKLCSDLNFYLHDCRIGSQQLTYKHIPDFYEKHCKFSEYVNNAVSNVLNKNNLLEVTAFLKCERLLKTLFTLSTPGGLKNKDILELTQIVKLEKIGVKLWKRGGGYAMSRKG